MNQALAYFLMYVSAAFYCGFDASIKEKQLQYSHTTPGVTFDFECEVTECVLKTMKFYDNGKFIDDGFVAMMGVLSDFNSTLFEKSKKQLDGCLSEMNQNVESSRYSRCDKLKIGAKLLQSCVDKREMSNNVLKLFH